MADDWKGHSGLNLPARRSGVMPLGFFDLKEHQIRRTGANLASTPCQFIYGKYEN